MQGWEEHVGCAQCGYVFSDAVEATRLPDRKPCPQCGSTDRRGHFIAPLKVGIDIHVHGKGKPAGGGKWFLKFVQGRPSWFRKLGRWHRVDRTINRRADRYDEVITDQEIGEVVHEDHGPLSEHQGHGDARKRHES